MELHQIACEDAAWPNTYRLTREQSWARIRDVLRDGYRNDARRLLRAIAQWKGPRGPMTIEVGIHPEMPTAMLFHSTDSGRFMPAGHEEIIDFINAAKRGELDGLFTTPPEHTSASADAPSRAEPNKRRVAQLAVLVEHIGNIGYDTDTDALRGVCETILSEIEAAR